jgi:S-formylglutathione hydrolase FrmB
MSHSLAPLRSFACILAGSACALAPLSTRGAQAPTAESSSGSAVVFRVSIGTSVPLPVSGRLLVFLKKGSGDKAVDTAEFNPEETWVAAREIRGVKPGASVEIDADEIAFPKPFSALPAGDYEAQAVVDVDHTYNYSGRGPQDWESAVTTLHDWTPGHGPEPALVVDQHPPANPRRSEMLAQAQASAKPGIAQPEKFTSPVLSRFWGRPISIEAWVILPPGYSDHPRERYPTAYWTHGFGGNFDYALVQGLAIRKRMEAGSMPPMIWVMLSEAIPEGTHEFADSANDGPWGTALTTEFIPQLERKYRMDARRDGRFLNGHSSGGWATLQLEVNYPNIFGGTWSTSPDPSDFHNFTGPDLYSAHANVYRQPDGTPWPIMRDKGKVIATFEQFARLEDVLGPYGGQVRSFDWVFSPKGPSGAPEPMFNHATGQVDPSVVNYWRNHYDLAHLCQMNWPDKGRELKGRIHLFVGTADTFYLDGSARLFEATLQKLGGDPHFNYLPDRTHFDLYTVGQDRMGLFDRIGTEMYAVARPGRQWRAKAAPETKK